MHTTISYAGSDTPPTGPPLMLFGPQFPRLSRGRLSELQTSIAGNSELGFLVDTITELPSLWPALEHVCPDLSKIPGAEELEQLQCFLESGALPNIKGLNNILLAPLTVIAQVVEFLSRSREGEHATAPTSFQTEYRSGNVQGFCVGFLAAAAVACSRNKTEFQQLASIALRLAVCIGAIVDLGERTLLDPLDHSSSLSVHWTMGWEQAHFERTLNRYSSAYISCITDKDMVTVTLPSRDAGSFAVQVANGGLSVQTIGLQGRFHHPDHVEIVQNIKDLCKQDKRFQLPNAERLVSPLRSNTNAKLIKDGALHDIALDSILTEQSQWYQTVGATIAAMGGKNIDIISIGTQGVLPRSVRADLNAETIAPNITNGFARVTNMLYQPSSHPAQGTPSDWSTAESAASGSDIAVIGMACRYPKAESLEQFWELIRSGGCAVQQVPKDRFDTSKLRRDPQGPFWGNFLRDPDTFDHRFFHISGREAKSMDPQQRLVLQVAYEAMESSGYCGLRSEGQPSEIGCYVGVGAVDYEDNVASEDATAFSATGTLRAFISGKMSHYFGWTGPSITYDTACSSSAVAIHSACKALQMKECSMAVAGGVNVMTSPALFQNLAAASFLSPTGASKAFDADANGYCRGEGAGIVVLKPLVRAIADDDFVLGVIAGSAINQGSNCTPITVPDSDSQSSLYQQTLSTAGVEATEVSYVEAHGTGTPVGDPIECESIRRTFGGAHRNQDLFLGSVKDNIGHAEAASGIAGLLKTVLMMQNRMIPKQANFSSLNPKISSLEKDRMKIAKHSQPWGSQRLTAVVNNYGAAGSNAAILLQEYPASSEKRVEPNLSSAHSYVPEFPFFLSARSPENLRSYCVALKSFVARTQEAHTDDALADVAYNLASKQSRGFEYTWTSTASNIASLSDQLETAAAGSNNFRKPPDQTRPVVLCFAGQTGQTVSLSEDLFNNCKLLQTHLVECDSICQNLGLESLFPRIFQISPVEDIVSLHCMLFSIQYAGAKSWLDCGLKVQTMIGHSFGQLTALCVAGFLSLTDGIRLISKRARLIQDQWGPETGIMLSIEEDSQEVETLLDMTKQHHSSCSAEIACYNGPRNIVIAGNKASIEAVEEVCRSEGPSTHLKLARLKNTHAFHSRLADSILPGLEEVAESINFKKPSIQVETCSAGQSWSEVNAQKILQHTRMPVYFSDAVERIAGRLKSSIWLDAGSGSSIIAMARRVLKADPSTQHIFLPVDLGGLNAQSNLAKASCELWAASSKAQFWPFHRCQKNWFKWMNLPPYQFDKTRHWIQYKPDVGFSPEIANGLANKQSELLQLLKHHDGENGEALFSVDFTHDVFKLCVRGHAVLGHSLCPASMYFELAVRAARVLASATSSNRIPHIQELGISSPLGLSPAGSLFLVLRKDKTRDERWKFSLFSRSPQEASDSTTHASGIVALLDVDGVASRFQSFKRLVGNSRCEQIMSSPVTNGLAGEVIYKVFGRAVDYANYYRGVTRVYAKDHEVVGHVSVPNDQPPNLTSGCCDPIAIDNFLQVAGIHVNCLSDCKEDEVFMCTAIGELSFSEHFIKRQTDKRLWTVYSNFEPTSKNRMVNDIFVLDFDSGELVLTIMGAQFRAVAVKSLSKSLSKANGFQRPNTPTKVRPTEVNSVSSERQDEVDGTKASSHQDAPNQNAVIASTDESQRDQVQLLKLVQDMLSDVLEIPTDEIQPDSALGDLGVDSLMMTEVSSEIKKRFDVTISAEDFQALTDLQSLCHRIQPSASIQGPNEHGHVIAIQTPEKNLQGSVSIQRPSENGYDGVNGHAIANHTPGKSLASISYDCLVSTRRTYDSVAREAGFIGFCHSVYPAQAELVVAYVVDAFTALGCPLASLSPGQRLPDIRYSQKHKQVVNQLYKILQDAHLITRGAGDVYRTDTQVPQTSAHVLQAALVEKFPKHASEHKLLHTTGPKLADCVTERVDPLSLLFRDAKARLLLEDVYTNAPMFKAGTMFLARYLVDVFRQFDHGREIKILELGAGTGGTTSYLINSLASSKQKFQYTFTDLSSSMVSAAKKKFARHSFMQYAVLDIEQTPAPRFSGQYDIIISTNCIHATRNLSSSGTNIRKMLREDGILCLVELTQNLFWFDLVFGLLEGWWLFEDGREHALASEGLWDQCLRRAGFQWVDWTQGDSEESQILRVIAASPSKALPAAREGSSNGPVDSRKTQETVTFKQEGENQLLADIYYPEEVGDGKAARPVALMIHGGGHVMLSRKDIRPKQTQTLLEAGFLPVSVDYRLCPERSLLEGPMRDVRDALRWARTVLPKLHLKRRDIRADGDQVVAVGWSTGGHLAMTLAWTSPAAGIKPPQAILSFYCPTNYEDAFWTRPNMPRGAENAAEKAGYDVWEAVYDQPITAYNVPAATRAVGGWMAPSDPRSRIALHMNWKGQTLPILLYGLNRQLRNKDDGGDPKLPHPTPERIQSVSPFAQIRRRKYQSPTFLVHGTLDDLIPWQQSQKTYEALRESGVEAEFRVVEGGVHLFDVYHRFEETEEAARAVSDGYRFLRAHVH